MRAYAVLAILAFAIVLLVLNLRERDLYLEGKSAPPPGPVNLDPTDATLSWLSLTTVHDGCEHKLEILENHRWMRIRDHDGWYRLFWAGDDLYYFDDPSPFGVALGNPTAREASGEWRIHARYVHETCPLRPEIRARYSLVAASATAHEPQAVPLEIRWVHTRHGAFAWKREEFAWSE